MRTVFYKYHALGNDYLVIDPNKSDISLTEESIRLICNRNFGVGSDGILYGPLPNQEELSLRIFNPDGSEAEKSGNGIRIFSRYLAEAGYTRERTFTLGTRGGNVTVELMNPDASMIKVDMGKVTFRSELIPAGGPPREVVNETLNVGGKPYRVTCLSIGNPHCVIHLPNVSKEMALKLGPQIENHEAFPNKINLQLLKVLDKNNIQIEIWERGAGYTLASGSSSCAAASAAYRLGLVGNQVTVHMPGGEIGIEIRPDGHVFMTGPVTGVAQGELSKDFIASIMGV